ncbi:FxDxF family PEP-CTERM protein [Aquincola tertiaricarbonis]|uniref:FxDxF family PEP-CTERM protein n=1 Tax=Aquincola tertiaricarbonis TaxID=391953 RepID=A0ABY4S0X3_AQUTE|nr:FxDxF family PEP-CTERM protein [Aquincola tertiaricarbonis]URI06667.1 FxDxF family PEP-CTERM protein [Aquincola tertiaricarbonis]
MKLHHFAAAAVLAISGAQAFAVSQSESLSFDALSATYSFGAKDISAANTSFTFTLDTTKGIAAGTYDILGSISGTNFSFSSVTLNGTAWDLSANSKGKVIFGEVELTSALPLTLTINGAKFGSTPGAFSGQLVMAPVPEPETYALMLAGLGAVGFVAYRRRSV